MKKTLFTLAIIIAMLSATLCANAQIKLVHTFDGHVNFSAKTAYVLDVGDLAYGGSYFRFSDLPEGLFYMGKWGSGQTYTETIYNNDFTLKSTNTHTFTPSGEFYPTCVYNTKKLFNNDDNSEYLVIGYGENDRLRLCLFNESDELIYDFGYLGNSTDYMGSYTGSYSCQIDNKCYFVVKRLSRNSSSDDYTYTTDVYLIDGVDSTNAPRKDTKQFTPYPNPSHTVINLPYSSEYRGKTIHIYNSQGSLMEQLSTPAESNQIQLNISNYPKGIYYYEINGTSQAFIVD